MTRSHQGGARPGIAGLPAPSASRGVGRWMMGDSLETRVRAIVAEQLGLDVGEVTPDAHILDDLGADSLDVVELMMTLEEAFDIEVPDEDHSRYPPLRSDEIASH